jgi:uncharacterized protein with HEPN domain
MRLDALKHLYDMKRAYRLLTEFIAGKTFGDDSSDALLRSAVERQLTIVGEARCRGPGPPWRGSHRGLSSRKGRRAW